MSIPVITIFVRHDPDCASRDDMFYKRCACWKHLRWVQKGRQIRRATKQRTWAGAERVRREIEAAFSRPGHDAAELRPAENPALTSVRQAVASFLQKKRGEHLAPITVKRYRCEMDRFAVFCESRSRNTLLQVTAQDVLDYRDTWDTFTPAKATQQKVRERLKAFFRFALRMKYTSVNLLEGHGRECLITPLRSDSAPTLPLTPAEFRQLLDAVDEVFADRAPAVNQDWYERKRRRVRAFVLCMRHTGLAIRDTVTLRRVHLIHDPHKQLTRVVTKRAKTGVDVSVPIPPAVAEELLQAPNANPEFVFWNSGTGTVLSAEKRWADTMRKLFQGAGLPGGHSHQLRDTFAVELLKAGVPLQDVSKALGHSSIKTTEKHYAPWVQGRQDRLDQSVMQAWAPEAQVTPRPPKWEVDQLMERMEINHRNPGGEGRANV